MGSSKSCLPMETLTLVGINYFVNPLNLCITLIMLSPGVAHENRLAWSVQVLVFMYELVLWAIKSQELSCLHFLETSAVKVVDTCSMQHSLLLLTIV
uniref:Uncharacterized protein n=1 Tax=Rhipicephalus zambeziensis TaxID=60191 RepID=A0A224YGP6_9ACAR